MIQKKKKRMLDNFLNIYKSIFRFKNNSMINKKINVEKGIYYQNHG